MFNKLLSYTDLLTLSLFGFFTRFWNLFYPQKVVFDETYFGSFATKYLSHQYYFDIHPPLGKMLFGIMAYLGNVSPKFGFVLNANYGDVNFLILRFLPALFGSLLIPLIYILVMELGFSRRTAFLASFMVLFDNALLVQSRFILMDIVLLFFVFLSLYMFVLIRRFSQFSNNWYIANILLGLFLGISISIKWTGFGILGIIWLVILLEDKLLSRTKKEIFSRVAFLFFIPLLFYFLVFAVHFTLLPLPCVDNCNIGINNQNYESEGFLRNNLISRFAETHKLIFLSDLNNKITDPNQSPWYSWPFMLRPINYFQESYGDKNSFIYFIGNPFVWWLGFLGVLSYLYITIRSRLHDPNSKSFQFFYNKSIFIVLFGYMVYTLAFSTVLRFTMLYHYLPALIFSIILFSITLEGYLGLFFKANDKKVKYIYLGILLIVLIGFLYFSPLTYGLTLTDNQYQRRMLFDVWQ